MKLWGSVPVWSEPGAFFCQASHGRLFSCVLYLPPLISLCMLLAVLLCIVAYGVGDNTQKGTLIQSPRSVQDNIFNLSLKALMRRSYGHRRDKTCLRDFRQSRDFTKKQYWQHRLNEEKLKTIWKTWKSWGLILFIDLHSYVAVPICVIHLKYIARTGFWP